MNILYINNGSGLGTAKSGGTARHIETVRWLRSQGVQVHIVTTTGALALYEREHISADFWVVRAALWRTTERHHWGRVWSYLLATIHTLALTRRLPAADLVYAPSDYFCDVVPAWYYSRVRRVPLVVMIHHLCRRPGQRRGNYLINLLSWLGQRATHALVVGRAKKILVYETPEGTAIAEQLASLGQAADSVVPVWNGLSLARIDAVNPVAERYEACFAGGLRASKGIDDIIPVWQLVTKHWPQARLAVAGVGPTAITARLQAQIAAAGLADRIILLGGLAPEQLYATIKSSQIFISLSREEGWGIAVSEALACRRPVVAFNLPAFQVFRPAIREVLLGDHQAMATAIEQLLTEPSMGVRAGEVGRELVERYDWAEISQKELVILQSCMESKL